MTNSTPSILITGAARGIGYAAAGLLAARGARVTLASRDAARAETAAQKIGATWVQLDITDQASVDRAVRGLDRLDVLVNNAAVLLDHYESLLQLKPETLRETLETNVTGTLRISQACAPLLARSRDARIINVSSGAGQLEGEPQPWAPAYSISKAALNMLTQQLVAALPDVMVNAMCTGWCRTDMGGAEAPLSAEQGADTMVWLALEAPRRQRGKFFRERREIAW